MSYHFEIETFKKNSEKYDELLQQVEDMRKQLLSICELNRRAIQKGRGECRTISIKGSPNFKPARTACQKPILQDEVCGVLNKILVDNPNS